MAEDPRGRRAACGDAGPADGAVPDEHGWPRDTGYVAPETEPVELTPAMARAHQEFGRHLTAERGLSPHTVRAYLGDVGSLLAHAQHCGLTGPGDIEIGILR